MADRNSKNKSASARAPAPGRSSLSAQVRKQGRRKAMRTIEISKVKSTGEVIQNRRPKGTRPQMNRPKPRHSPLSVTAEYGRVSPRRLKRKGGVRQTAAVVKKEAKIVTVKVKSTRLPWHLILTAFTATLIIMAMVINYVRVNELTNQYSQLQQDIVSLSLNKKKLTMTLEQKNDLLYIEEEAEKMGMVKSDRVEKRYVSMENEDKIAVPEQAGGGLGAFFSDLWEKITGPFRNIFG